MDTLVYSLTSALSSLSPLTLTELGYYDDGSFGIRHENVVQLLIATRMSSTSQWSPLPAEDDPARVTDSFRSE